MRIEPMVMRDYEEVHSLWTGSDHIGLSSSDSRKNIKKFLRRNPGMSFVARCDGRIIGAVLCGHDGHRGCLNHLAVARDHRREGVGKALVRRCVKALKAAGIIGCNLFIWNSNRAGRRFWQSQGWVAPDDWGVMNRRF